MLISKISHFLNEQGNIVKGMPKEARELAFFLTFIIEATTNFDSEDGYNTGIRCNKKNCQGKIQSRLLIEENNEIYWRCPVCSNAGIISEWEGTKWDRS